MGLPTDPVSSKEIQISYEIVLFKHLDTNQFKASLKLDSCERIGLDSPLNHRLILPLNYKFIQYNYSDISP
ncbi:hypothetical protein NARC_40124 [Candidatus Nitrosocosmicus arcticus]|uniref:Uncharacterized protein n=2 Tax=Candidatus Nitrosocosmicus arcticus TaxID=2035267 RepID=A0A557SX47_9ARCH|nr:hypothetical protein NARC_40124 [Candidatus Nitrosocosmicus arcticus]